MTDQQTVILNVDLTTSSTFTGRSVENGLPVSVPLHGLEEVLAWVSNDSEDHGQIFSVAQFPYNPKLRSDSDPKTLVCHDMKGGYIVDRFAQGCKLKDSNWYNFTHWDVVDTFVYFSHHFVTIPPVGWINAAHKNSVAVLGTVITEGIGGELRWKAILSSEEIWKKLADQLVAISMYYGFEGWLLNVENKIKKDSISSLVAFTKYLHEKTKDNVAGGQIIWYDSVTADGTLHWQNELNDENSLFFDVCDGIFLNYFWNESGIESTLKRAGSRATDVYVGIDVFGRSTYGGGGFNAIKALQIIRKYKLSTAIFAPGWVKEVLGEKLFSVNQQKFWNDLGAILPSYASKTNGFASEFNNGMCQYYNLSSQDFLPRLSFNNNIKLTDNTGIEIRPGLTSCVVYKVYLSVPQGSKVQLKLDDYSGNVLLKIQKAASDFEIVSMKQIECPPKGYVLVYPEQYSEDFQVYEIICEPQSHVGILNSIKLTVVNTENNNLQLTKQEYTENVPLPILLSLENVSWKNQEHEFLLSVVLCFNSLPSDVVHSVVSYGCNCELANDPSTGKPAPFPVLTPSKLVYTKLGSAYCPKYRVNELKIPNPMFYGPSSVVFQVNHYTAFHILAATSLLEINYFENFRS